MAQIKEIINKKYFPYVLSALGLIAYILLAMHYIHHIQPVMDEATYLIKGRWYWEGFYTPFEDYGPITNKPPLAFYILGIPQVMFGVGLRSGRYFALFLSVLLLFGQWLTMRKISNVWWAAGSIFLYVVSPAWIIYFSRALTQVVVAVLVAWCLFFILGKDQKEWQNALGAILGAGTVMVRQNMLPLYLLVVLFILWSRGIKNGWRPILLSGIILLLYHALYWPQIYQVIWQPYLPDFFNDFIYAVFRVTEPTGDLGTLYLDKQYGWKYELQVFFDSVRYFFLPLSSSLLIFLLLPIKKLVRDEKWREVLFLASSFLVMTGIHFLAVLKTNNTLYSFPAYYAFYLPLGVCTIPYTFKSLFDDNIKPRSVLTIFFVLVISTGIGFSLYRDIASALMKLKIPSLNFKHYFLGQYELWDVLLHRFQIDISTQEFLLPAIFGLVFGLCFIACMQIILVIGKKKSAFKTSKFSIMILAFLLIGIVLSPTNILAGKGSIESCDSVDVLAHYEKVGEYLRRIIPNNAQVYWEGFIPVPLIYLPEAQIFPAQLNMEFYLVEGGDIDFVERKGLWSDEIAARWLEEAKYIILDESTLAKRQEQIHTISDRNYSLWSTNFPVNPCTEGTIMHIFKVVE